MFYPRVLSDVRGGSPPSTTYLFSLARILTKNREPRLRRQSFREFAITEGWSEKAWRIEDLDWRLENDKVSYILVHL